MTPCASPTYRKRRRERLLRASRAGVAARERNRLARAEESGKWPRVRSLLLIVTASPDGRHVGIHAHDTGAWYMCGTERAVRAALAKMLWGSRQ